MKRWMVIMILVLLLGSWAVPASAESEASKVELYCTVNADGDCLVSMTVNLHLEAADKNLTFPLPANASGIKLNGGAVGTSSGTDSTLVAIGGALGGAVGDIPVRFDYTLPKAVKVNADRHLQLDLPMLCGFAYPVGSLTFIITLPDNITTKPNFNSIYQQNGFESNLDLIINGNMITGSSKGGLNDHEAVTMTMIVPEAMFPTVSTYQREGNPELIPMGICAGLALLYWLLFLRTLPPQRVRSTAGPAGVGAGELGCRLTMTGGDLSMMVLSWAQMGYLLIHLDGNGRVLLHKRMDMGNERSLFEVRTFQALFGSHRVVDCTGSQYAKIVKRTRSMVPGEQTMCKPHSGNRKIFRWLLCIAQLFCGICVAMNMTGIVVLEVLFSVLFGIFGLISGWQIQNVAYCTRLRHRTGITVGLIECVIWVLLGTIAHQPWIPLGAVVVQLLMGYLAAYGGMRTELNRFEAGEILGLRRYLKYIPREEAGRLQKTDPDFFFRMAPYAIAMGVGKPFAAAFGRRKMDQCPYFVTRVHGHRTGEEWMRLMLTSVALMDQRARRNELEKWLAIRIR